MKCAQDLVEKLLARSLGGSSPQQVRSLGPDILRVVDGYGVLTPREARSLVAGILNVLLTLSEVKFLEANILREVENTTT